MWKPHPCVIKETQLYANTQKLKKPLSELNNSYLKEQTECIQNQIHNIRDSVEDKKIEDCKSDCKWGEKKEEYRES